MDAGRDLPAAWVVPATLRQLVEAGDGEWVEELMAVFQADTTSRLDLMGRALANADYGAVRAQAHAIKGGAIQVGAERLADVCRQVELEAGKVQPVDLARLFQCVLQSFEQARRAISVRESAGYEASRGE